MRNKCKNCGNNCEGDFCFKHKPRKPFPKIGKKSENTDIGEILDKRHQFFTFIWNIKLPHECENCGKWLGKEPLSYMFDHLLEKSKYPELEYEEDNICYICLECHDNKTRGFPGEKHKQLIEKAKIRYEK